MEHALIRAFFAIDLPNTIKKELGKFIQQLKNVNAQSAIRWTAVDNLHITLQFMAALQSNDIENLLTSVRKTILTEKPFVVSLSALELFPSALQPHAISLGVTNQNQLSALAKAIGSGISACGYEIEKRVFRGHLTLARIKGPIHWQPIALPSIPEIYVKEVTLFRSDPHEKGSRYTPLAEIAL